VFRLKPGSAGLFSVGMGRPMPGHARPVVLKGFGCGPLTNGQVLCVPMIPVSIEPESYCMKRLTEWINLIAAVVRLIDALIRTGWVGSA
jgi:hypothetical protein